jgi:hypothetical protein
MNGTKYIGLDVHQATISAAVLDSAGKLVMEAVLETKAETIPPENACDGTTTPSAGADRQGRNSGASGRDAVRHAQFNLRAEELFLGLLSMIL